MVKIPQFTRHDDPDFLPREKHGMFIHGLVRKNYIGVDPGKHGGMAWIQVLWNADKTYSEHVQVIKKPVVKPDLHLNAVWEWVQGIPWNSKVGIEKVSGYFGDSKGNLGSSMFKFGEDFGQLEMALSIWMCGNFQYVYPQTWYKGLGIPFKQKHETKTQAKKMLWAIAVKMFPEVEIPANLADALLIAEYVRRCDEGLIR